MANVFLQQGDVALLDRIVADAFLLADLRLFQNNHTPAVDDVDGDYVEADFSGYASVALSAWSAAFVNGSGKGEIDGGLSTFSHDGGGTGNTVFGAYVTDADGHVVYAELFPAPQVMEALGNSIDYTPVVTAVSQ